MVKVKPRGNEHFSVTLKRWKKLCEREGILRDIRRCQAYEKPSEKRRRTKIRSIKRIRKEQLEEEGRLKGMHR